jgi:hypothetical protein
METEMTNDRHRTTTLRAGALMATLSLGACTSLPTAVVELPDSLAMATPLTLEGPLGAARGDFRFGDLQGRFERQATRLDLFGRLAQDRALVNYTLQPDGLRADCKLIANTATLGALQVPLKRADYACTFSRNGQPLQQRLDLKAEGAAAGTREERRGTFVAGNVKLEVQSLHRVQGSPLPLPAPVGYLVRHQGQVVATLDLNDLRPRLWQQTPDAAVSVAVLQASLALALLWDPVAR